MKLLDKYNRISLIITVLVIVITGIIYYFTISLVLTDQVDKDLLVEEHEIFDYVKSNNSLPQVFKSEDLKISFQPIGQSTIQRRFIDTRYRDDKDGDEESGRCLISSVNVKGQNYRITIVESKVETEDLIRMIFLITIGLILILLATILLINRLVLRNLWKPFYEMLQQIKLFNLTDHNTLTAQDTPIEEFNDMNKEVMGMSLRVSRDYRELKNFVENASHELLTPLAIINSKLDTLVQTDSFSEHQSSLLNDVYTSVSRLTRLNQAMLLLSRIENQLIPGTEPVDLEALVKESVTQLHEFYDDKNIRLSLNLTHKVLNANRYLIEVLLNNMLINAIRHNTANGTIAITLTNDELMVENTGVAQDLSGQNIFKRFNKSAGSEGSGLGLTICNQICQNFGYKLSYSYQQGRHAFIVRFNPDQKPE